MRRVALLWICLLMALPAAAQQPDSPPTYTAFYIARLLAESGTAVDVEFVVSNQGGPASQTAQVELRELGNPALLDSAQIPPLGEEETYEVLLTVPLNAFPDVTYEQEQVVFELSINSPEFERVRLSTQFTLPAPPPGVELPPPATATATPTTPSTTTDGPDWLTQAQEGLTAAVQTLPLENLDVDFNDPVQVGWLVLVIVGVAVVLWIISVIFRLIFIPAPTYPNHPPPYADMPQRNPDSIPGRRQMWQPVAQNGSMLAEDIEGTLHPRKLLEDTTGERYAGWKIVGLRASQYDAYGRVARTQVIAPRGRLRRLNNAIAHAESIAPSEAERRVRPVAKYLARQLRRQINKRGAGLPIALDLKFRGIHGEVNIYFELYQYQVGAWRRLDRWQPEMTVPGKFIYETYTYTVHGIQPDESMRDFRKRLRTDITHRLTEMVLCTPPPIQPAPPRADESNRAPTPEQPSPPVEFDVGETQQSQPPVRDDAPPTDNAVAPVPPPDDNDDPQDTDKHKHDEQPDAETDEQTED